ncbi:hypothetical protein EI94DRAFT_1895695 [Lactarius quietus]|nr:hypothetical protein EI94DRAFT_1895695 [Lactarius quietus]
MYIGYQPLHPSSCGRVGIWGRSRAVPACDAPSRPVSPVRPALLQLSQCSPCTVVAAVAVVSRSSLLPGGNAVATAEIVVVVTGECARGKGLGWWDGGVMPVAGGFGGGRKIANNLSLSSRSTGPPTQLRVTTLTPTMLQLQAHRPHPDDLGNHQDDDIMSTATTVIPGTKRRTDETTTSITRRTTAMAAVALRQQYQRGAPLTVAGDVVGDGDGDGISARRIVAAGGYDILLDIMSLSMLHRKAQL